jgi:hypothetical protein
MAEQQTYVPGYVHDCFVSYGWVDDQVLPSSGASDGWVHALVEDLKVLLAQQLGRSNWGEVWIDRRLDPTKPITPEVEAAAQGSATLLLVLSEGWLVSPWCPHELDLFARRHQASGGTDGRIFPIHRTRIDPERRPNPIRDLIGFDFYTIGDNGAERLLGFPIPVPESPDYQLYCARLDDLSRALGRRLRELQAATGAAPLQAPMPPTIAPQVDRATAVKPIFLAETTPDLRQYRDLLARQLDQSGFATSPTLCLPATPDDYRQVARRELAGSLLFVQILGRFTSDKRPDLPQGYEALQLELAQEAGLPILRWMDPSVDREQLDDPTLYHLAEVVVCGFDDFKRRVEDQARRLLIPPPTPSDTNTQVLIRAAAADEDTACDIGDRLHAEHGVGYEVADESVPLADLVRREPSAYQGLMVVYDRCDPAWVRGQLQECRVIAMGLKELAPVCAVLDQPREGKRRLGIKPPRFHWLSALDGPELGQFLQAIAAVPTP